ncbi:MAG: carbohydrate ABC transporter permease [Oscillospiraceae bacterium]|jgi:putative aldouronate transport system permease protein|nr:carbohydrate ABC transporter permease [Oscillospiraceae bacterium]
MNNIAVGAQAQPQRVRIRLKRLTLFDVVVLFFATLAGLITIYPMWYVIIMSLSDPIYASGSKVTLWPIGFYLGSYSVVLREMQFWISMRNSVLYVLIGTVLMLVTTMMVAYPLTRPNLKGRKACVVFLLIPMYFSGGMIPSFIIITQLGLYNTPWATILPASYGIWNIILCKTFLQAIPHELAEAAYIDGASNYQALSRIYLPLAKPVLAVISIYTVVGVWNSWFGAKLYQTNANIQPVQLYLQKLLIEQSLNINKMIEQNMTEDMIRALNMRAISARQLKYSMIVVVTLPILLVYPMFQKHFVKGVMLGSLKG